MLLLTCPVCAITADQTEFACGGPYEAGDRYVRGPAREWWLCENGCGSWFGLMRHVSNQTIYAVWQADNPPPAGDAG